MDSQIKSLSALSEEERKRLAEAFIQTVESKLKKEEHHTWMVSDYDHQKPNR